MCGISQHGHATAQRLYRLTGASLCELGAVWTDVSGISQAGSPQEPAQPGGGLDSGGSRTESGREGSLRQGQGLRSRRHGLAMFAGLPDELAQEYPESASGDPGFLQDWEEATLTEFFVVDVLVVTSLTETPGVLEMPDRTDRSPAGRCVRSHGACRRAGKTLVIRDWGAVGQNNCLQGGDG